MLSSVRLILRVRIVNLLRRVIATVEPDVPLPSVQRPNADPRRPAPPAHWVELVQQYAPHLLEPAESDVTALPAQPTESEWTGTPGESLTVPQGSVVVYRK